ncbi:MAG: hypothetical protein GY928_08030 [Colwellia sp.]|nr:hypothetical protein [Colwellia sp.]
MAAVTYLQLYIQHCRVEASVNDIVVVRKNEKDIVTISTPIHEYLIAGENTLGLHSKPYSGSEFEPSAQIHLRVANFEEGEFLEFDQGQQLCEIVFHSDHLSNNTSKSLFSHRSRFLAQARQPWFWQNAGVLSLNKQVISSLNKLIGSLHRDFGSKKPSHIAALVKYQIEELAFCYPMENAAARRQQLIEYITAPTKEGARSMVPLDSNNLGYRLAANGRLVECIGKDGLPLIRTVTTNTDAPFKDESYTALPMHIGYIKNDFWILR